MRRKLLLATLAWLLAGVALAQINIPREIESSPPRPIVATISNPIPQGATFDGGWSGDAGLGLIKVDGATVHVWATPGKHTIKFSGFWLLLKEVRFKDGDGNEVVIQSYLGHGFIDESADFTVLGGNGPDPPPGPDPVGPYQIMFFSDHVQFPSYPRGQQQLLNSLSIREDLEAKGHVFLEVLDRETVNLGVPEKYRPFAKAVAGDPYPRVAFAPKAGGTTVLDFDLPADYAGLLALLNSPQYAAFFSVYRGQK